MELYTQSADVVQFIVSVAVPTVVGLVSLVLVVFGGGELAKQIRVASQKAQPLVDEPTDTAVQIVEKVGEYLLKTDLDPKAISEVLHSVTVALAGVGLKPDA